MNQKQMGVALSAIGAVILVAAAVLSIGSSSDDPIAGDSPIVGTTNAEATTATTVAPVSSTRAAPTTTTAAIATTTTAPPTTTTMAPTTTTTIADTDLVESFIVAFGEALESGDVEFVLASLHPGIVFGFGTDVCRTWVETQVMGISEYVQTGPVIGPTSGSLGTPGGDASFEVVYSAPVTFEFSGASFAADPDFVVEGGTVYFTGACDI